LKSKKKKLWLVYFHDESDFAGVMSIKEWNSSDTTQLIEYKRYRKWERAIQVADKHAKLRYNIT
jgi:lipopolysaccharide biosynthesis regulator YciM